MMFQLTPLAIELTLELFKRDSPI